jgi:predicted negative regulator of RcsB-dependent stress response
MSQATSAQTQTLEQALNKTDFGHLLYENRKLFFGFLLTIVIGVTGWVTYKESQKTSALKESVEVFDFQTKYWAEAKGGKITGLELLSAFEKLDSKIQATPVMLPLALEMAKFLFEKGQFAEANTLLSKVEGTTKHPVSSFFVGMQRAIILEQLGKIDEAIASVEKVAQIKDVLVPARVFIELGRLYTLKGDKGKAQTQFDYVLQTYPNDEAAKLAKLYLSQLAQ